MLPVHDWIAETNELIAKLPDDIRRALYPDGFIQDQGAGPARLLSEVGVPDAPGTNQRWHGDNKLVQAKPLPNLHGKWADGEMVFSFPEALQAEQFYSYSLIWLLPGQVNMTLRPDEEQYSVHVSPQVQRDQPMLVRKLIALSDDLLKA